MDESCHKNIFDLKLIINFVFEAIPPQLSQLTCRVL